jgi:hypothetical protein
MQRIPTQNPQANSHRLHQEHVSQALLTPDGQNDRDAPSATRSCDRGMGQGYPLTDPSQFLFPCPAPPRKKSTTHPKTSPHEISHHQCTYPDIDPIDKPPSINPVNWTTANDSYPQLASDRVLTPSRTCISSPLVIAREQRRARSI